MLNVNCGNFRGMTVTSGSVVLSKDEKNLIGISIGGGAPLCPCLYIVQVIIFLPFLRNINYLSPLLFAVLSKGLFYSQGIKNIFNL